MAHPPDDFDQIALPAPEYKHVASERALPRRLLRLGRKRGKALAHVRHAGRQPDLRFHWDRDHPDSLRISRASASGS
jgi:hypothetical protein